MTAEELKNIRKDIFKATQAEFANMIGVSKNTVTRWKMGIRHPTTSKVKLIRVLIALKQ